MTPGVHVLIPPPPEGFVYEPEFITVAEEAVLVAFIRGLPLEEAKYLQYTARRRAVSFGGSYDFSSQELRAASPIPEFLHPVRARIAALMGTPPESVNHALVAEYRPGTPRGGHRDVADLELGGGH